MRKGNNVNSRRSLVTFNEVLHFFLTLVCVIILASMLMYVVNSPGNEHVFLPNYIL
jgi:hypothetical protein